MNEFDAIQKYFRPLTEGHDALQDDAAILNIPVGHELIVTSDTLNAALARVYVDPELRALGIPVD